MKLNRNKKILIGLFCIGCVIFLYKYFNPYLIEGFDEKKYKIAIDYYLKNMPDENDLIINSMNNPSNIREAIKLIKLAYIDIKTAHDMINPVKENMTDRERGRNAREKEEAEAKAAIDKTIADRAAAEKEIADKAAADKAAADEKASADKAAANKQQIDDALQKAKDSISKANVLIEQIFKDIPSKIRKPDDPMTDSDIFFQIIGAMPIVLTEALKSLS